ncbi:MAG: VOC family protein [Candidatus Tectimicrobiota bacterium]
MAIIHDIVQVGVGVPDREHFEQFTQDILGFPVSRSADGQVTYMRTDQYCHRLAVRTTAQPVLYYVGFDVGSNEALAEWEMTLSARGIPCRRGTPQECVTRQVEDFIEFQDPDGHHLALTAGFETRKEPVHYTRDLSVLRLGHVLLTVADTHRTQAFYTEVLGFRLSDWVYVNDDTHLCFLRCNARHHALAFAPCAPGKAPRLQHLMLEVESLDDVMRTYHFLRKRQVPIGMGPGRHVNCQTIHVYVPTPGGFALEYGWGHRRLDDAIHQPVIYPPGTPIDVWGGDIQSAEFQLG